MPRHGAELHRVRAARLAAQKAVYAFWATLEARDRTPEEWAGVMNEKRRLDAAYERLLCEEEGLIAAARARPLRPAVADSLARARRQCARALPLFLSAISDGDDAEAARQAAQQVIHSVETYLRRLDAVEGGA